MVFPGLRPGAAAAALFRVGGGSGVAAVHEIRQMYGTGIFIQAHLRGAGKIM